MMCHVSCIKNQKRTMFFFMLPYTTVNCTADKCFTPGYHQLRMMKNDSIEIFLYHLRMNPINMMRSRSSLSIFLLAVKKGK